MRGSLLLTTTGGGIEQQIGDVQWAFIQLFVAILGITVALSLYLSRSITRPIVQLAASADQLRMTRDTSLTVFSIAKASKKSLPLPPFERLPPNFVRL